MILWVFSMYCLCFYLLNTGFLDLENARSHFRTGDMSRQKYWWWKYKIWHNYSWGCTKWGYQGVFPISILISSYGANSRWVRAGGKYSKFFFSIWLFFSWFWWIWVSSIIKIHYFILYAIIGLKFPLNSTIEWRHSNLNISKKKDEMAYKIE